WPARVASIVPVGSASDSALIGVEGIGIVGLLVCYALLGLARFLRRTRPEFDLGKPLAVAIGVRFLAIAAIASTGLSSTLRGGDETTFLAYAKQLAATPWGTGFLPH